MLRLIACLYVLSFITPALADEPSREDKLAEFLTDCQFVGHFTVDGKEDRVPKTERYTIGKCERLPEADMYRMTTTITYGDVNNEVPIDVKILWSGSTPVITLDNLWIPGMGTFSSRVLIHGDRYAGTWQHGEKGGHLFGSVEQQETSVEK